MQEQVDRNSRWHCRYHTSGRVVTARTPFSAWQAACVKELSWVMAAGGIAVASTSALLPKPANEATGEPVPAVPGASL